MYISDPKNSTKELLQQVNTFSKVTRHKINPQKLVVLLNTNDKETEKEVKEITFLVIALNNIKYLGVILSKHVKDMCDKSFKSLKREFEEAIRR
jgi:hypothetical protein